MQQTILIEDRLILVARCGDAPQGFTICDPTNSFMQALYVDPAASRRGIGASLLDASETAMAASGVTTCTLFASHNAVAFYKAHGFSAGAPTSQSLADGATLSCLTMSKQLQPNNSFKPKPLRGSA